jgi:hypothetical protein
MGEGKGKDRGDRRKKSEREEYSLTQNERFFLLLKRGYMTHLSIIHQKIK